MKARHAGIAAVVMALGAGSAHAGNREVIEKWLNAVDSKQTDKLGEFEQPDIEMKTPMGLTKGTAAHVQLSKGFSAAFPNMKHTLTQCIEQGDSISCEGKFTGDHGGPMALPNGQSLPATGKHVEFDWLALAKVKGGKVASAHVYFDAAGFMQQLMPAQDAKASAR